MVTLAYLHPETQTDPAADAGDASSDANSGDTSPYTNGGNVPQEADSSNALPGTSSTPPGTSSTPPGTSSSGPPPWPRMDRLLRALEQEGPFLIVPFKRYEKLITANYSFAHEEVNAITSALTEAADGDISLDDAVKVLSSLASKLRALKQELGDGSLKEELQAQRFMARYNHLDEAPIDGFWNWNKLRVSRIIVDYLLRMSYRDTAIMLTQATNIQELVDIEEFDEATKVIIALQKKEVAPALAWCANNNYMLKKYESKLELNLRLQEFVDLVWAENHLQAITYAKKYIAPWGQTHMKDLQQVLATLALRSTTRCSRYKVLFEEKQWDRLIDQFKREFYKLHGMTYEPLLYIYLQAGLIALKTPLSYKDDCAKEDPLSHESFRKLASPLPFRKYVPETKLVCHISKMVMDAWNVPVILPNGHIYGYQAVFVMICQNDGNITCPKTGVMCRYEDVIMQLINDSTDLVGNFLGY